MRRIVLAVVIFAGVAPYGIASGQFQDELRVGARVRMVPEGGKTTVGTLIGLTNDSISFVTEKSRAAVRTLAVTDVDRVQISRGPSRGKGALLKGLIGLGIGATTGALLGAASYEEESCNSDESGCYFGCIVICSRGQAAGAVGIGGGLIGLVIGGVIGTVTGWESWSDVIPKKTNPAVVSELPSDGAISNGSKLSGKWR